MLFADLAGYTALAETLDPEEVYGFLRPTMAELQTIVEFYGGTVPQMLGDGFMAIFGVPVAHEDDAERAVRAALEVRDRVRVLNRKRSGIQVPEIHAGVNSGEVMVAPSDETAGFTVIGDTVNVAARLSGLAAGGHILVGEATRNRTSEAIRYGPRRLRKAKGKAEALVTFEALAVAERAPPAPGRAFVDRYDMLAMLGRELHQTELDGRGRVLMVTGEPGIGKSRLALELGSSLPADRFLLGRCPPFGARPLLSALAEAVGAALGLAPGTSVSMARAAIDTAARRIGRGQHPAALAADLRALLAIDDDVPRSDRDAARAARLVLEDRARAGPVVVVLDDLQWADRALVELLADAYRNPWPAPVLILGLSRARVPGLPSTPLPGLDDGSMRVLAEILLGSDGSTEAAGVPVSRANGNALFLEEMVEMLVESGAIRAHGGSWRIVDPSVTSDVPQTIRLLIAARLDALPPEQKELLQDASVCGTVTWDALLAVVSDVADRRGALRALVSRGLLRRNQPSTVPDTEEYEWKHALIRDVAYGALPKALRAARHTQIAEWLRSTARAGREPVAAIAYHYELAWELALSKTDPVPDTMGGRLAAEYLTRWAEQTFVRQARAAEPLFRRALRVTDAAGSAADVETAARASLGLAEALIEMGSHPEAIDRAMQARRLADRAGDGNLGARALLALGRAENDAGRLRRARSLLEAARQRFEAVGDLRGQGWALHRLSETWEWADLAREVNDLRGAYAIFARARDRFGRAVVANDLAYILSVEGDAQFHRWYQQARRLVEGEGDLRSRASLLRTWAHYCYSAGRFTEAIEGAEACRPVAAEAGDRYTESDALVFGALAGARAGDPAIAVSLAREAGLIGNGLGSVRIPALARLAIARAEVRRGRPVAATRALRQARAAIDQHGVRVMHGDLTETEAMVALDRGQWEPAESSAQALRAALHAVPMRLWTPLPALIRGRALLGVARPDEAAAAFHEAVLAAEEAEADGALALAKAYAAQALLLAGRRAGRIPSHAAVISDAEVAAVVVETAGIAALLRDDPRAAVTALDTAVERWERFGSTSWLARALSLRAAALRAAGDRAPAAASMARARATMDAVGMPARSRAGIEHPLESAS
jgi:class 3 adenylate cyclase/tetratricopeptide (TPR) repeat protein